MVQRWAVGVRVSMAGWEYHQCQAECASDQCEKMSNFFIWN